MNNGDDKQTVGTTMQGQQTVGKSNEQGGQQMKGVGATNEQGGGN